MAKHGHDHGEACGHDRRGHDGHGHDGHREDGAPEREGHDGHGHDGHGDHEHRHGLGGHHHGPPSTIGRSFFVGICANFAFVALEAVYGVLSHSMALVADAGHNLGDVLGLVLAWGALTLAKRKATPERTYGFRATTVVAALANGVVLVAVTGGIAWEAVRRLFQPEVVAGRTVIVVALAGVVVNGVSALLFFRERNKDLNVKGAFAHLAADAALSLGVAIAGGITLFTSWRWVDPVVSLIVAAIILGGTWSLLRDAVNLVLDAVPSGIDSRAVAAYLASLDGVRGVHDLHIWATSTTETALTAHLVVAGGAFPPGLHSEIAGVLQKRFRIDHPTLQVEAPGEAPCRLEGACCP
jgi:cobalt-zinc-cadmium efflux system protein